MGEGSVSPTAPAPWPNPTTGNTTVSVVNGLTGTVIDTLDANPPTGWNTDIQAIACVGCTISKQTDTKAADAFVGTGRLKVTAALTVGAGSVARVYFNYGSPQDWSGFTHLSFYIKNDALFDASLFNGAPLQIFEGISLSSPVSYPLNASILSLQLLNAGAYTQVIVAISGQPGTTRDAVRSYGLVFPSLASVALNGVIPIDQIMAGPAGPVFSSNTVRQDLIPGPQARGLFF